MSILLTATNSFSAESIVSFVIGVIIIGLMIFFIYRNYSSNENNKELLDKFFDNIQDIAKNHIIEAIEKFDFSNVKKSFAEIQADFIKGMYDDIWDLCVSEMDKLKGNDDILYSVLKKLLTKDKIQDYVITLFSDESIQDKLTDIYNTALEEKMEEIKQEDEKLEKESEEYDMGEISEASHIQKLDPSKVPGVEEEEIIPPVEEESDIVSKDDPTVEIISEDISSKLSESIDEDNCDDCDHL